MTESPCKIQISSCIPPQSLQVRYVTAEVLSQYRSIQSLLARSGNLLLQAQSLQIGPDAAGLDGKLL